MCLGNLNGNGAIDVNDMMLFFNKMDRITTNEPVGASDDDHLQRSSEPTIRSISVHSIFRSAAPGYALLCWQGVVIRFRKNSI